MASSPAAADRVSLTLYGRQHCHLCHEMIAALEKLQARLPFRFDIVDIDGDEALRSRYNELVPVLVGEGEEICRYHLDQAALARFLEKT
ncbi:MAG: thioredoxin family protein [Nitrosospira sp. 56-18]|nr:glutaredoxin family protein [Nitrosospira sp.]OJY13349.1 MAG: thioredoxin family protein [Nitrosospira sp. 56-18]